MSKLRGNPVEFNGKEWVFSGTKSPSSGYLKRACGHCGSDYSKEGHDGCIGQLPGLMNACCGHGDISDTYVQFIDGFSVHGEDARAIIEILKKSRDSDDEYIKKDIVQWSKNDNTILVTLNLEVMKK